MKLRWTVALIAGLIVAGACGGGATGGRGIKGNVTLWHPYQAGGAEERALTQLIDQVKKDSPEANISVVAVPSDQILNRFQTEAASGGGPDLFTAPNDELGSEVRAKLLLALDDRVKGRLDNVAPIGIDGLRVDGKLYGVPMLLRVVALYYHTEKIAAPPKTTEELRAAVGRGRTIVQTQSPYHLFGWAQAFGGKLMDANGKCIADQGGWAEALQYLVDLKKAGARFDTDTGRADAAFRKGQVEMIITGSWALSDYKKDLGGKVAVAPMPAGPKGKAGPLTGVDGWYVNAHTKNADGAIALALALTDAAGQKVYADVAGDVPVRTDVSVNDPLVKALSDASATGLARPHSAEFANYWAPFGDAVAKIMEGRVTPQAGIAEACAAMNRANKK